MKPFSVLFEGSDQIEYHGKTIRKYYKLDTPGEYTFSFKFVKSESPFHQAIVLFFLNFKGDFYLRDQKYKLPNSQFPKVNFWFDKTQEVFSVKIELIEGSVLICNGSDPIGNKQICHSLCLGCAIQIEKQNKTLIFYCNDHENDDDFDDLIFEVICDEETFLPL